MVKNETLKAILDMVQNFTEEFLNDSSVQLQSEVIAKELSLTRSSVSRYLNSCYNKNQLIKINTRPVIYLDVKTIEKQVGNVNTYDYISIEEFLSKNNLKKKKYNFEDLIGYKETLYEIISSLKSEVHYPGNRILVLHFVGAKGVGKKRLALSLLKYCIENDIKGLYEKLYIYKVSYMSKNKDKLFGSDGFIHNAKKGILYIERADLLTEEDQEIFVNYLSSFEERKIEIKCIIFSSEENNMIDSLQHKITSTYSIPDLKNRTKLEREVFVEHFLKLESNKFEKEIYISKFAFQALSLSDYEDNLDGLSSSIIKILANVNMASEQKIIIKTYNLVDLLPDYHYLLNSEGDNTILSFKDIDQMLSQDDLLEKYDSFIQVYDKFAQFKINLETYFKESSLILNNIIDYLILNMSMNNEKFNNLTILISNICDLIRTRYGIYIYKNMVLMLSKVVYKLAYLDSNIKEWSKQNELQLEKVKELYTKRYDKAAIIANKIEKLIYQFVEIELDPITCMNIILLIANENEMIHRDYGALIVAHGYATASSIANTANKLLSKHIFDAIDMPLDASALDIAKKMDSYITDSVFMRNLILLVDMGSLEEITSMINSYENVRIGLINNVSTKIALSIGEGITNGEHIEEIMQNAQKCSLSNYKIVSKNLGEPVIVFASEAGESISNKFIQLFDISLPRKIDVKIMSYDYFELMKNKEDDVLFKNYNILLILGINTKISNCPYIPFEELLTNESIYILDNILKGLSYEEQEIRQFNSNILKYYSLENVMNTITILNVNVLIDLIDDALKKLQISLSMKIEPKVMYGLFIHLGSLIERLVMKLSNNTYSDIQRFEEEEQEFISCFKKSFEKIMRYYNVEIPIAEIAYLHDYIMNWV